MGDQYQYTNMSTERISITKNFLKSGRIFFFFCSVFDQRKTFTCSLSKRLRSEARCSQQSIIWTEYSLYVDAGLNSILFAINIDNTDLNGQARAAASVSLLLKESTQGMSSLWKESAQGVSTLLREIGTATAVVPGFAPRSDCSSDPLPVLPRSTSAGTGESIGTCYGIDLSFYFLLLTLFMVIIHTKVTVHRFIIMPLLGNRSY